MVTGHDGGSGECRSIDDRSARRGRPPHPGSNNRRRSLTCLTLIVAAATSPAAADEWYGTLQTADWYDFYLIPCEPACGWLCITNWSVLPTVDCDFPLPVDSAVIPSGYSVDLSEPAIVLYLDCAGDLTLRGDLTVLLDSQFSGDLTWRNGHIDASDATVSSSDLVELISDETKWLDNAVFQNDGFVLWLDGGNLEFHDSTFENNGTFDIHNDQSLFGTNAIFDNNGVLQKVGGGGTTYLANDLEFNNLGVVNVAAGRLEVQGGGSAGGSFQVGQASSVDIVTSPYTFADGASQTGAGVLRIAGTTATCQGAMSAANMQLDGCTFRLGALTVSNALRLTGDTGNTLDASQIVSLGGGEWSGLGDVTMQSSAVLENRGTFDIMNDQTVLNGPLGSVIRNLGLLRKSGGPGVTTISIRTGLENSGDIAVNQGSILTLGGGWSSGPFSLSDGAAFEINATTFTLLPGAGVTGGGYFRLRDGVTLSVDADVIAENVEVASQIAGGTIGGTGKLTVTSHWNLLGDATKALRTPVLVNQGRAVWSGGGDISFFSTSPFANEGIFEVQNDRTFQGTAGVAFENIGTFRKSAGDGETTILGAPFNNSGLVELQRGTLKLRGGGSAIGRFELAAGTTLHIAQGDYTLNIGSAAIGDGYVRVQGATLNVPGAARADNVDMFSQLIVDGTLTSADHFIWNGSPLNGDGMLLLEPQSMMDITGSANRNLNIALLRTEGQTNWTATGTVSMAQDAVWENSGTLDVYSDAAVPWGGGSPRIDNSGTFRKLGGSGIKSIHVAFNNSGIVEMSSGTLDLHGGTSSGLFTLGDGTLLQWGANSSLEDGALIQGVGYAKTAGNRPTINGAVSIEHADINGLSVNGTLTVDAHAIGGIGTLTGPGTLRIAPAASMEIVGSGSLNLPLFDNAGMITWTGTGSLTMNSTAVWRNRGTIEAYTDAAVPRGSGTPRIENEGAFRKLGGSGTKTIYVAFSNTGEIEVAAGTLRVGVDQLVSGVLTAGTWLVRDNATLDLSNSQNITTNRGVVVLDGPTSSFPRCDSLRTNEGTFVLDHGRTFASATAWTNSGVLTVGAGGSRLDIGSNQSFDQMTNGRLDVHVAGAGAGENGVVQVSGTATLAGRLTVTMVDGFVATAGDQFTILTAAAISGVFSEIDAVGLPAKLQLAVSYSNTAVVVSVESRSDGGPTGDEQNNGSMRRLSPP
ncbi:MAG: hypothetical protein CHACPFDD_01774 [Phycisphaerae bacterium]|nr:hypothetical protein [Phycisphaerae bacterium]